MKKCIFPIVFALFSVHFLGISALNIDDPNHVSNWKVSYENELKKAPKGVCVDGPCLQSTCFADKKFDELKTFLGAGTVQRILPLSIAIGNWNSHLLSASAARILLHEFMGYNVTMFYSTNTKYIYHHVARGEVSLNFEAWPSSKLVQQKFFVRDEQSVLEKFMGTLASDGLYVPNYMLTTEFESLLTHRVGLINPELVSRFTKDGYTNDSILRDQSSNEYHCKSIPTHLWGKRSHCYSGKFIPTQCFPLNQNNISSNCYEMLLAAPGWNTGWYEGIVNNLNLNFTIVYTGTTGAEVRRRYKNKIPQIFYWFEPDSLTANFPSSSVYLKTFSQACSKGFTPDPYTSKVDCNAAAELLTKLISSDMAEFEQDLMAFFALYSLGLKDQELLLRTLANNRTVEEAACMWLQDNIDTWERWISNKYAPVKECDEGFSEQYTTKLGVSILVCVKCPKGKFNRGVIRPRMCRECPLGAVCPGGSHLRAKKGYWQGSNTIFYPCNPPENCCPSGNCSYRSNNSCTVSRNSSSHLCGKCYSNFTTFRNACGICRGTYYTPWVCLVIATVIIVIFLYRKVAGVSATSTILVDYYQIVSVILRDSHYLKRLQKMANVVMMQPGEFFIDKHDCMFGGSWLQDSISPYYILLVILLTMVAIIIVHYFLSKRFFSVKFEFYKYINVGWRFLITTYGIIVNAGLSILHCQKIDNVYVVSKYNGIICDLNDPKYAVIAIVSGFLVLFVTAIPLWIVWKMLKLNKSEKISLALVSLTKRSHRDPQTRVAPATNAIKHQPTVRRFTPSIGRKQRGKQPARDLRKTEVYLQEIRKLSIFNSQRQVCYCYRRSVQVWYLAYFLLRRTILIVISILLNGYMKYFCLFMCLLLLTLVQIYFQPYIRFRDNMLHSFFLLLMAAIACLQLGIELAGEESETSHNVLLEFVVYCLYAPIFPITIELLFRIVGWGKKWNRKNEHQ